VVKADHHRAAREEDALALRRAAGETSTMAKTLDHLPPGKQCELRFVIQVLTEEFAKDLAKREDALKIGKILKIILFGSYARGDWVEDPVGRYFSDYDLLIVVDHEKLTDVPEFWDSAERRLLAELSAGQKLRTPVNFIVHGLDDVNDQLSRGRYFFVDIARDGIPLLEMEGHPLVEPKPLEAATALDEAQEYFSEYYQNAERRFDVAHTTIEKGYLKEAAFDLHQVVERLYTGLLLVVTLYTPKSHNLVRLRNLAEPLDPRLIGVWPTETKFQKRCFELLRAAYVKARYSRHYKVTPQELAWMQERIEVLQGLVKELSEAKLESLRQAAGHPPTASRPANPPPPA
jgi:predicted nucleotidyltransferase/HEPN domain-containing protein